AMKIQICCGIAALTLVLASCGKSKVTPDNGSNPGNTGGTGGGTAGGTTTESVYLTNAKATHAFITSGYATSYGSYRVNTTTNTNGAFEWYVASQLYADAAMVSQGDASYQASMNNTFSWLGKLVDKTDANGG